MAVYYDQLNRAVELFQTPQRIISTVPSQTELLFDIGLKEKIIGVTTFCIHPAGQTKIVTKIGGTKKLNIRLIKELKPDLIIANKEENDRAQVEELMNICPVWISDISNLAGAIAMISAVGELLGHQMQAQNISDAILSKFNQLATIQVNRRVAYLIWRKPYLVAGKNTFIDNMLQTCGLTNAFELSRYPEINREMLLKAKPDIVFLSSEPYPFNEKHITEFKSILPKARIVLVDGEMFSWYGSRLLHAPEYLSSLMESITEIPLNE